jgi:predicted nucleic acid-binding Zn ribbon protein
VDGRQALNSAALPPDAAAHGGVFFCGDAMRPGNLSCSAKCYGRRQKTAKIEMAFTASAASQAGTK